MLGTTTMEGGFHGESANELRGTLNYSDNTGVAPNETLMNCLKIFYIASEITQHHEKHQNDEEGLLKVHRNKDVHGIQATIPKWNAFILLLSRREHFNTYSQLAYGISRT